MPKVNLVAHSEMQPHKFYLVDRSKDFGEGMENVVAGPFHTPDEGQEVRRQMWQKGNRYTILLGAPKMRAINQRDIDRTRIIARLERIEGLLNTLGIEDDIDAVVVDIVEQINAAKAEVRSCL